MNYQLNPPHAVIMHGQAVHLAAIARAFHCDLVVPGFSPLSSPLVPRGLHISDHAPAPGSFAPDILILSASEAQDAAAKGGA